MLEKTLENPLDSKKIKSVNSKGNQSSLVTQTVVNSLENTLMLAKTEGKKRSEQQRMRWLDSNTDSMDINLRKLLEILKDKGPWCAVVHRVEKSITQLSN